MCIVVLLEKLAGRFETAATLTKLAFAGCPVSVCAGRLRYL